MTIHWHEFDCPASFSRLFTAGKVLCPLPLILTLLLVGRAWLSSERPCGYAALTVFTKNALSLSMKSYWTHYKNNSKNSNLCWAFTETSSRSFANSPEYLHCHLLSTTGTVISLHFFFFYVKFSWRQVHVFLLFYWKLGKEKEMREVLYINKKYKYFIFYNDFISLNYGLK